MDIIPVLSHEIRSPLTTIRAYADVLMRSTRVLSDEETKEYASAIKRAADQANRLIGNVLDVSLSESGTLSLLLESFSLEDLVIKIIHEMKNEARGRSIEAIVPADMADIEGDLIKIERVLRNLVANAIRFSPQDGKILVSVRVIDGNFNKGHSMGAPDRILPANVRTPAVVVSVKDNGVGISQEELEKIFTKFYRNLTGNNRGPGLGIGLYVCKQIVEAHGGKIWVKSRPRRGSDFSFAIPTRSSQSSVSLNI